MECYHSSPYFRRRFSSFGGMNPCNRVFIVTWLIKGENGVGEACKLQRDFLSVCRIGAKPDLSHAVVKRGGEGCSVRAWCGIAAFQDFLPLVCNFVRDVSHGVLPFVRGSAYHKRQR